MDCDNSTDDVGMEGDVDDFVDGILSFGSSSDSIGGVRVNEIFGLLLLTVSFEAAEGAVAAVSFGKNTK